MKKKLFFGGVFIILAYVTLFVGYNMKNKNQDLEAKRETTKEQSVILSENSQNKEDNESIAVSENVMEENLTADAFEESNAE